MTNKPQTVQISSCHISCVYKWFIIGIVLLHFYLRSVFAYIHICVHPKAHVDRSKNNLQESFFSFHYMPTGDQIQDIRLSGKYF